VSKFLQSRPHADDIWSAAANWVFRFRFGGGGGALINFCRRRRRVIFAGGGGAARRQFDNKAKFKKYSGGTYYVHKRKVSQSQYHNHNVQLLQANLQILQPIHK